MQEHGVLERILLVYEESERRSGRGDVVDPSVISRAAALVRGFVEDYHEYLEEAQVFPRLEVAHRELELIGILRRQHQRGRQATDEMLRISGSVSRVTPELAGLLAGFVRMYRPHAAREDTVLFPAFRRVVGAEEYRELGEQFEELEHTRVGEEGFRNAVAEIASLEQELGIGDLSGVTMS